MKHKKKEINKLCSTCTEKCKQSINVILLRCPNYKFEQQQLEFKFTFTKKKKKVLKDIPKTR